MAVTLHVRISGRVQGVGYRDALRTHALACRVTGWVRNCRDGSVEAVIQGEPGDLETLLAWARRGPPAARVADVQASAAPREHDRPYSGFDWLPSA